MKRAILYLLAVLPSLVCIAGRSGATADEPRATVQLAVGPHWSELGPAQRTELVAHFKRMSIATFAVRFDSYSGERFEVLGQTEAPQGRVVVLSRLARTAGEPVPLNYVFTEADGGWRAVDVCLQGTIANLRSIARSSYRF